MYTVGCAHLLLLVCTYVVVPLCVGESESSADLSSWCPRRQRGDSQTGEATIYFIWEGDWLFHPNSFEK